MPPPANPASENPSPAPDAPGRECPACGALHSKPVKFCEECGASLARPRRRTSAGAQASAPRTGRSAARSATDEGSAAPEGEQERAPLSLDREGRKVANVELRRAKRRLRFVRVMLWLNFVFNAIGTAVLFGQGEVLIGAISLGFTAIALTGVLTLHRYPFGWTIGLAGLQTLTMIAAIAEGDRPVLGLVVAALLWGAVPVTARASRLLREHGDVYDENLLRSTREARAPRGETRARAEARAGEARRTRLRSLALVAGVVVVVLVGGRFAYRAATRPAVLPPRLEAFRAALGRGDAAAGEDLCTPDYRGSSWLKVQTILEREGWLPAGVALGVPDFVRDGANYAEVHFALPRGLMKTRWVLVEREWWLDGVIFSGVKQG